MTRTNLTIAIATGILLVGCDAQDPSEEGSTQDGAPVVAVESSVSELDIQEGLNALELGDETAIVYAEGLESALLRLREEPSDTLATWRGVYDQHLAVEDFDVRFSLIYMLSDLCLTEATDTLIELAAQPVPERSEHSGCSDMTPHTMADRAQELSIGALGRVTGASCGELPDRDQYLSERGRDTLGTWVLDASLSKRMRQLAGEALLEDHEELAAQLRAQLVADDEWMLTPYEERRVEMVVDNTPPTQPLQAKVGKAGPVTSGPSDSLAVAQSNEPLYISASCAATVNAGWNTNATGDDFVASNISWGAWLGSETCGELHSRYDSEVVFQNNTWDEGFGWNTPCDDRKPMKRAVNGLWVLENASTSPNAHGDFSGGVINWAYDYIKHKTPEFEGSCGVGNIAATTYTNDWCFWPFCGDERIELHLPMWAQNVAVRAGLLVHEARHAGGYSHNASAASCPAGGSCDSAYSYRGANTLEVQWLAQYFRANNASNAAMRLAARSRANNVLRNSYAQCPNVQLDSNGWFYSVPGC